MGVTLVAGDVGKVVNTLVGVVVPTELGGLVGKAATSAVGTAVISFSPKEVSVG